MTRRALLAALPFPSRIPGLKPKPAAVWITFPPTPAQAKLIERFRSDRDRLEREADDYFNAQFHQAHLGDPCRFCLTPHDLVPPGPCTGHLSKS